MDAEMDPLEGSSYSMSMPVKEEIKEEDDDHFNTMALLELAQCVQTNQEPIEFNSTDAMMDPKTGHMVCLHCLEDFDPTLLSDHMVNIHNYRRALFKCQTCTMTFQERKLLTIHKGGCQPEPNKRKRQTFRQLVKDIEAKYGNENVDLLETAPCPICMFEIPKYCMKDHLLNEHRKPEENATCGRCNRLFKSKLTLREHVKLVHESIEDSVECEMCGQKFRSLKYLSNHKRNVHPRGDKIHKCEICNKEYKSRLCLHQHIKYVHPPESAMVECPHCPKKMFKSKINLHQHLKVSHGVYSRLQANNISSAQSRNTTESFTQNNTASFPQSQANTESFAQTGNNTESFVQTRNVIDSYAQNYASRATMTE